jgi:hypothetical protein
VNSQAVDRAVEMWNGGSAAPMTVRSPAEIARFFTGWHLIERGVVTCSQWRPDGNDTTPASEYAGVARRPRSACGRPDPTGAGRARDP